MLTSKLLKDFDKVLSNAIEHTIEEDLKHDNSKLFQLSKNGDNLIVEFTLAEIADYLEVDIKVIRRVRESKNCKLYNMGYRITTIEYKH